MSYSKNNAINIPTSHYVGFDKRGNDTLPLGFMTPDGTDKAAQKRKDTVDRWANSNSRFYNPTTKQYEVAKSIPAVSLENKPMAGFKLGRNISGGGSGWNSRHDKWRIEDPRGFQLEISSGNLEEIMRLSTIELGEILEKCVWARLGQENILLPIASEAYAKADANTTRLKTKGSVRDLVPGCTATLKDGTEILFVGRPYVLALEQYTRNSDNVVDYSVRKIDLHTEIFEKTRFIAYYVIVDGKKTGLLQLKKSISVAYVDTTTTRPEEELFAEANADLSGRGASITGKAYDYAKVIALLQEYDSSTVTIDRQVELVGDFNDLVKAIAANQPKDGGHYHDWRYFVIHDKANNFWGKGYYRDYNGSGNTIAGAFPDHYNYCIDKDELFLNKRIRLVYQEVSNNSYWGSRTSRQNVTMKIPATATVGDYDFYTITYGVTVKGKDTHKFYMTNYY